MDDRTGTDAPILFLRWRCRHLARCVTYLIIYMNGGEMIHADRGVLDRHLTSDGILTTVTLCTHRWQPDRDMQSLFWSYCVQEIP